MPHTSGPAPLCAHLARAGLLDARSRRRPPARAETVARRLVTSLPQGLGAVLVDLGLDRPSREQAHGTVRVCLRLLNLVRRFVSDAPGPWLARLDEVLGRAAVLGRGDRSHRAHEVRRAQVVTEALAHAASALDATLVQHDEGECDGVCAARAALARRWVSLTQEGLALADGRAAAEAHDLSGVAAAIPNVGLARHHARLAVRWTDPHEPLILLDHLERLLEAELAAGDAAAAAEVGERALELADRYLAAHDPQTLAVANQLCRAWSMLSRHEDAVALARRVVWDCECAFGEAAPESWEAYTLLAHALRAADEVDAAIGVTRHQIELHRNDLLDVSPRHLIGAGFDLATTYLMAGDTGEAERTAREMLDLSEARLGPGERLTQLLRGLVSSF